MRASSRENVLRFQQTLDHTATRLTFLEGINPTTMKNRLLRVAAELGIPVTVRTVPGGLLFWRSTAEDLAQAKEIAQRLQPTQRKGRARLGQRRREAMQRPASAATAHSSPRVAVRDAPRPAARQPYVACQRPMTELCNEALTPRRHTVPGSFPTTSEVTCRKKMSP
jgi:hypothetical protein